MLTQGETVDFYFGEAFRCVNLPEVKKGVKYCFCSSTQDTTRFIIKQVFVGTDTVAVLTTDLLELIEISTVSKVLQTFYVETLHIQIQRLSRVMQWLQLGRIPHGKRPRML